MRKVNLHLNHAGYCYAKESHAIRDGRKKKIVFNALWGLIEHPSEGLILYDTGYANRFFDVTKKFPNRIYAKMTQVLIDPKDEVIAQLEENGILASDIRHVIVTHFHADHVAGLKDFPNATIYCSGNALKQALKIPRAFAFSKGILKGLLPIDLELRTKIIEEVAKLDQDPILGETYDLFGDDSIKMISLPGHAAGQMGVLLETRKNPYLLIADAAWLKQSYEKLKLPNQIVRLFFHSWSDFKLSLKKVHDYYKTHPETVVVPTHCSESTEPLISRKIDFNEL